MTIKIAGDQYKQNSEYYEQQIRHLIVDGVERYRLVVGEGGTGTTGLVYAKGKIHFNWNWPKLGDGETHPYIWKGRASVDTGAISTIYAFYKDGFYDTGHENWNKDTFYYYGKKLSEVVGGEGRDFDSYWTTGLKGWFTAPSGGKQIRSLNDVEEKTDLFNYKTKTDTIPEITLYAHWEVPKIKITVHNVKFYCKEKPKLSSKTSFVYEGKRTTKSKSFYVLPCSNIITEVNKRVSKPRYVTWADHMLDNPKLRKGPQKFVGWYINNDFRGDTFRNLGDNETGWDHDNDHLSIDVTTHGWHPNYFYKKDGNERFPDEPTVENRKFDVYPCFEPLVIIRKTTSPTNKGKTIGGKFYTIDLLQEVYNSDNTIADEYVTLFDPSWPRELEGVNPNPFPHNGQTIKEYDYYYEYVEWEPTYTEGYFYGTTYSSEYSDGTYRPGYRYYYGSTIVYTLKKKKGYYDISYE